MQMKNRLLYFVYLLLKLFQEISINRKDFQTKE